MAAREGVNAGTRSHALAPSRNEGLYAGLLISGELPSMVQDIPNLYAHVESRAQRPLWALLIGTLLGLGAFILWGCVCALPHRRGTGCAAADCGMTGRGLILAICIALTPLGIVRAEIVPGSDRNAEAAIEQARDLFLANRLMEALRALDEQTLAQSGKANLLAGLIHLYRPRIDAEAAKVHLERAGKLGIAHAYTILGNITINEDCAECPARANGFYQKAIDRGDSGEARFGHALVLIKLDMTDAAQQQLQHLSSESIPPIRIWAASLLGTILLESNPDQAEELLSMAATEDVAEAQATLGIFLLRKGQDESGRFWLTRAIAHRSELAMNWYRNLPVDQQGSVLLSSAGYLLDLASSKKNAEFSHAAEWCGRSGRIDLNCLSRAADHHHECALSLATRDLLQIVEFQKSAVYHSCRSREEFGKPLPERPSAWPFVSE